jgi:hypothetical protein
MVIAASSRPCRTAQSHWLSTIIILNKTTSILVIAYSTIVNKKKKKKAIDVLTINSLGSVVK